MKDSTIHRIAFFVYAVALILFPLKTVFDQERTLDHGTEFHFKCAPVDPTDIFRGKYVQLAFDNNTLEMETIDIDLAKPVYGLIAVDIDGFAYVSDISNQIFNNGSYLELNDVFISDSLVTFDFPFERFYMNEEKAPQAEELYRDQISEESSIVYAKVFVNNGRALLDDVYVNDQPLKNLIN